MVKQKNSWIKSLGHIILWPFWIALWLFGLGLLIWYPLRWWPGDQLLAVRLINYFLPWLLLGLVPGLILSLLARRYRLATVLALPTLLVGLTYAPLFLPQPPTALAGNATLKVMSYNIWGRNEQVDEIATVIKTQQPDILLLQEVNWPVADKLNDQLIDLYPNSNPYLLYEPGMGQAIVSRFPLTAAGESFKNGRVQKALVDTPDGIIAVWNVHPYQPLAWSKQYRQISALADDIANTDGPLIVGGDFNTTDQAETYRFINQHLRNAHWEAGWGFSFSFPAHTPRFKRIPIITPLVRIDHIFYSDHFFTRSAQTLPTSGGSDHFPVTAELSPVK